ncbi:MAG: hypothetical protein L0Y44_15305 [Phycisphaerales bacterium]|nr:hypothetical protein [Phycisphaerales bacterium]MCI0676879.1 hypothetical protein [Phycisphaerales bacterium]
MPRTRMQGYYEDESTRTAQRLGEIISELYMSTDERDVQRLWNSAHRLLLKTKADVERVKTVMTQRRIGALAKLVSDLSLAPKLAGATAPKEAPVVGDSIQRASSAQAPTASGPFSGPAATAPGQPSAPSPDELKSAMKAFRKRLKLTRLNDESKLGRNPMSTGKHSAVVAIMPPREYRQVVWDQLVKEGKLKSSGGGFLELVE